MKLEEALEKAKTKKRPKLNTNVDKEIEGKIIQKRRVEQKVKKVRNSVEGSSSEGECEDITCIYCQEPYSNSKSEEGWIRCQYCISWAHETCAGIDSDGCEKFTCEFCA